VAVLRVLVDRRTRLFGSQLPDVLKLTSSSLRAGFSLLQGLESVTKQVKEPSKGEFQRVLAEAVSAALEDALEAAADRIQNRDFTESVVAVRIQQESGVTWRCCSTLWPRRWSSGSGCGERCAR